MDNDNETFDTICRACLKHGQADKMVSLIENSNENKLSTYGKYFGKFVKDNVEQIEYLPNKLCEMCKKSLEMIVSFVNTCEASYKKLSKVINFSLKQDLKDDMVKEVIRQYTLFNQNFLENSKTSTNQSSNDKDLFLKKTKLEDTNCPRVKVEVDMQQVSSGESDDEKALTELKRQTDNVDIFLYSIETLLTTKIDNTLMSKEVKPKTDKKIKAQEQDFTCNICNRVLANPSTYRYHMQRHGNCKYVCDQCGNGYPVLAELTQHQIYRHGIGSTLECDQCSFKAARRLELIEHIRLHTGERPFTCEKCGTTFRRKAIYKNHLKSHGERTVPCDYCPKKFYRRSQMLSHSNNVHDRVHVYLCKVCNVTYAMAKTVRRHMLVKHGIPRNLQGKVVKITKSSDSSFFKDNKDEFHDMNDVL